MHGKGKSSSENEVDDEDDEDDVQVWGRKFNISLLDQHTELKKLAEGMNFYSMKLKLLFFLKSLSQIKNMLFFNS